MSEEPLNTDRLYLALTRPAMVFGVPLEAAFISVMIGGLAMILGDSLFYLILAAAAARNLLLRRQTRSERLSAFSSASFDTGAKCRNRGFWGGSSPSPAAGSAALSRIGEVD